MDQESVTIIDNRTDAQYHVPLFKGCIRAADLRQIKVHTEDFGMMTYDPAFMNTASCQSEHHLYRWRQGHSALSRLPHRGTRGELQLP